MKKFAAFFSALFIILACGYAGIWFYKAEIIKKSVLSELDEFKNNPSHELSFDYEKVSVSGFPLNHILHITRPSIQITSKEGPVTFIILGDLSAALLPGKVRRFASNDPLVLRGENWNTPIQFILKGEKELEILQTNAQDAPLAEFLGIKGLRLKNKKGELEWKADNTHGVHIMEEMLFSLDEAAESEELLLYPFSIKGEGLVNPSDPSNPLQFNLKGKLIAKGNRDFSNLDKLEQGSITLELDPIQLSSPQFTGTDRFQLSLEKQGEKLLFQILGKKHQEVLEGKKEIIQGVVDAELQMDISEKENVLFKINDISGWRDQFGIRIEGEASLSQDSTQAHFVIRLHNYKDLIKNIGENYNRLIALENIKNSSIPIFKINESGINRVIELVHAISDDPQRSQRDLTITIQSKGAIETTTVGSLTIPQLIEKAQNVFYEALMQQDIIMEKTTIVN